MAIIKKKDLKKYQPTKPKEELEELVDADGSPIEGDEPQGTTSQIHVAPQQTTDDFARQAIQPNDYFKNGGSINYRRVSEEKMIDLIENILSKNKNV